MRLMLLFPPMHFDRKKIPYGLMDVSSRLVMPPAIILLKTKIYKSQCVIQEVNHTRICLIVPPVLGINLDLDLVGYKSL